MEPSACCGIGKRELGNGSETLEVLAALEVLEVLSAADEDIRPPAGSRRVADTALGVLKLGVDISAIEMSRTWLIDPAPFGDTQPRLGEMADVSEGDVEVQVEF